MSLFDLQPLSGVGALFLKTRLFAARMMSRRGDGQEARVAVIYSPVLGRHEPQLSHELRSVEDKPEA